ncbi:MAG: hypothetical protein IKY91_03530, partial [Akkermansia sp.]|nr:hypothetical protein [Akkermansia sp.]
MQSKSEKNWCFFLAKYQVLCVLTAIIAAYAIFSYYLPLHDEGLRHYNCLSIAESWHSAKLSFIQKNPRFGEMAAYFLGHNAGTYYFFLNTSFMVGAVLLIFRLSTGIWPGNNIKSSLILLLIAFSIVGFRSDITWPL